VSCAQTAKLIETPFEMLSWVDRGTTNDMGLQIYPCEGAILRGKGMPQQARHSDMDCAKMVEPRCCLGYGLGWTQGSMYLRGSRSPCEGQFL